MRGARITLILVMITALAFVKAYAAPVARSAAVWPDAVAVVVGDQLAILSSLSDDILYTHQFEGRAFGGCVRVGRRLFVKVGTTVIQFEIDQMKLQPSSRTRPISTVLEATAPLDQRAVQLTDGSWIWVCLAKEYGPGSTTGLHIFDAANRTLLRTLHNEWNYGGMAFALAGNTLVVGNTLKADVHGYSIANIIEEPQQPGPSWTWRSDNELQDIIASPDQHTVFVIQGTLRPWATSMAGHPRLSPSCGVTALGASSGEHKWSSVLVPGDKTGMYLRLRDFTVHRGRVLMVSTREDLGGGDLYWYVEYHHDGADVNDFCYYVFCVDEATGRLLWKYQTQGIDGIVGVAGPTVYVQTDRELLADIRRWMEDPGPAYTPAPTNRTAKLLALDLVSGQPLWTIPAAELLVATDSLAYVRLGDGSVVAVDSVNGEIRYEYVFGKES